MKISEIKSHLISLIDSIESEETLQKIIRIVENTLHPELSNWLSISNSFDQEPEKFVPYQKVIKDIRSKLEENRKISQ